MNRPGNDRIARAVFFACLAGAVFVSGVLWHKFRLFPYSIAQSVLAEAKAGLAVIRDPDDPFAYRTPAEPVEIARSYLPEAINPGLTLVYGAGEEKAMIARIIDRDGRTLHGWDVDMFELWPDMTHVPEDRRPKSPPGGEIAGLVLLPDGDIVFNVEPLGMMRMGYCGEVRWQLPYPTHHSVQLGEKRNFHVSGQVFHREPDPDWPALLAPFTEDTIIEVTPDGRIVTEISLLDVIRQNGLEGRLMSGAGSKFGATRSGDLTHLNDVEPFPSTMAEGVFRHGDLMVSLRNINTILVFDPVTRAMRWSYTGDVIYQHDPDFLDGNRISIFDNHALVPSQINRDTRPDHVSSRIVTVDARDDSLTVDFDGSGRIPFFTDIMGKHQWLPNGNLLITEARWGRILEITPDGRLAWEYNNLLSQGFTAGRVGFLYEAQRLPAAFDAATATRLDQSCTTPNSP